MRYVENANIIMQKKIFAPTEVTRTVIVGKQRKNAARIKKKLGTMEYPDH